MLKTRRLQYSIFVDDIIDPKSFYCFNDRSDELVSPQEGRVVLHAVQGFIALLSTERRKFAEASTAFTIYFKKRFFRWGVDRIQFGEPNDDGSWNIHISEFR